MCWHCQSEVTGEYLCGRCIKVQPLSKDLDYFTCMKLPRRLNIDLTQLETTFYELSRAFHPDFFSQKDETEKSISLGNSALLNTAYRTLKDPIRRAEYLVRLEAGAAKDIRANPPADLFEEILELQEDLEEFDALSPESDQERMEALRTKLEEDRRTLEQRLAQLDAALFRKFDEWDALQETEVVTDDIQTKKQRILQELREILSNRTYVRNILADVVQRLS